MPSPLRAGILAGPYGHPTVYLERPPRARLTEVVASTWYGRAGWERRLRVLPDGCTELVWNGRLWVVGAISRAVWEPVSPAVESVGIRLRPGVAGTVLGCPAYELPSRLKLLETLWGADAVRLEERLASSSSKRAVLEDALIRRLADRKLDRVTMAAAAGFPEGISERHLRRRFHEQVGYGPKTLHRVLRFQRFVQKLPALARGFSLAQTAAELGYADQSHLGRECRELAGSSPKALVRQWAARREVGRNLPDR